jgi:2-dehydro-3-deoxygalactonokinase
MCFIYVDAGTTNTRLWLARGRQVLNRKQATVGVRDTARDGSPDRLHLTLRDLIAQVRAEAGPADQPLAVVAAGMITSSLGLVEVPHVSAPAGLTELARSVERHSFAHITDLPVLLTPGVRSGPARCHADTAHEVDLIRGEETLCVGLLEHGWLAAGGTLVNLGSHWKAIRVDSECRIASSKTSLSGELIHATQTQTILASAVDSGQPDSLEKEWLEAGMHEQRRSGLARALFCVRLLEQRSDSTPDQRLAFLVGAFLASDLDALIAQGFLRKGEAVTICGAGGLAKAWRESLESAEIAATVLGEADLERAMLAGLATIASAAAPKLS